jgi:Mn-dependent DtxR family transcriptional regulator
MSQARESRNIEKYIEALYSLTQNGKKATTIEISERLKIPPSKCDANAKNWKIRAT